MKNMQFLTRSCQELKYRETIKMTANLFIQNMTKFHVTLLSCNDKLIPGFALGHVNARM